MRRRRSTPSDADDVDLASVRADLAEVLDRHERTDDQRRPDAVARRRDARPAHAPRENVADLVDAGSFVEYGPLVVAAQRRRRSLEELIDRTPADGLVGGVGTVDRSIRSSRCRTTTPCSPARRGSWTTRRRTGCSSSPSAGACRSCSSPKAAAAARATPTGSACRGSTASRSTTSPRLSGLVPLVGHRVGVLLRRQRGAPRVLRRRHRRRRLEHRHGRPGDDRGRRTRRVRADRRSGRSTTQVANGVIDIAVDDDAAAVRGREAVPLVLRRRDRRVGVRRPARAAPPRPREPRRGSTTCGP